MEIALPSGQLSLRASAFCYMMTGRMQHADIVAETTSPLWARSKRYFGWLSGQFKR